MNSYYLYVTALEHAGFDQRCELVPGLWRLIIDYVRLYNPLSYHLDPIFYDMLGTIRTHSDIFMLLELSTFDEMLAPIIANIIYQRIGSYDTLSEEILNEEPEFLASLMESELLNIEQICELIRAYRLIFIRRPLADYSDIQFLGEQVYTCLEALFNQVPVISGYAASAA